MKGAPALAVLVGVLLVELPEVAREIIPGRSTREDVLRLLGRPSCETRTEADELMWDFVARGRDLPLWTGYAVLIRLSRDGTVQFIDSNMMQPAFRPWHPDCR